MKNVPRDVNGVKTAIGVPLYPTPKMGIIQRGITISSVLKTNDRFMKYSTAVHIFNDEIANCLSSSGRGSLTSDRVLRTVTYLDAQHQADSQSRFLGVGIITASLREDRRVQWRCQSKTVSTCMAHRTHWQKTLNVITTHYNPSTCQSMRLFMTVWTQNSFLALWCARYPLVNEILFDEISNRSMRAFCGPKPALTERFCYSIFGDLGRIDDDIFFYSIHVLQEVWFISWCIFQRRWNKCGDLESHTKVLFDCCCNQPMILFIWSCQLEK